MPEARSSRIRARISRLVSLPKTTKPPPRIQIQAIEPELDCGRYPVKCIAGDRVDVYATIFVDGHDVLGASVRAKPPKGKAHEEPLTDLGNDRFGGSFVVDRPGRWTFRIAAWTDRLATWQYELRRKLEAGQLDLDGELAEGATLLGRTSLTVEEGLAAGGEVRHGEVTSAALGVDVDRERGGFGAWYELFPRSFGGFKGVAASLPRLAELGFDVVYLPPVHPIGVTNRKGRNNTLKAGPNDPGSPWAIGSKLGGHDAIDPALGTWADFDVMIAAAGKAGIEIALDFAIQCSPDHPWLTEHPEWFNRRPDGTLKYAENPPKRYQDIYNVNFESEDWRSLWEALRDVVLFWVGKGVRAFRVDNPHTKPVAFWEWLIAEVRSKYPEVIFLSEAFTRPAKMTTLAKARRSRRATPTSRGRTRSPSCRSTSRSCSTGRRSIARTPSSTRQTSSTSTCSRAGRRPSRRASCLRRRSRCAPTGSTPGTRGLRERAGRAGSRSTSTEKYEVKKRKLDGPLLPLIARLNAVRRSAGPSTRRQPPVARDRERPADRLREERPRDLVAQPRSVHRHARACA